MKCEWQAFVELLPIWLRDDVDKQGRSHLQELRLRLNHPPMMVFQDENILLTRPVSTEDLEFCINVSTKYSPWSAGTVSHGYITAPGGHRIGLGGRYVSADGQNLRIQSPVSLCIRVARDFIGIAQETTRYRNSILIIGKPGSGKTTLLRDVVRQRGEISGRCIVVVDEKEEIFPQIHNRACFATGCYTDIISGCSKSRGIEMAIRNMSPETIAVDEITAAEDCEALIYAGWCGVNLIATAHASCVEELYCRPVYKPLVQSGLFQQVLIVGPDKRWHAERMQK